MRGPFFQLLRRQLASSSAPAGVATRPPYETAELLLKDPGLQSILVQFELGVDTKVSSSSTKLELLKYFSTKCKVPVTSDAYQTMSTPAEMANWYSKQLRPCQARPHARNLIVNELNDGQKTEEMEDEIDLNREKVQEQLMDKIPDNLILDDRTFLSPDDQWVRQRKAPKWRKKRKAGQQ